jgi:hypothetical protein
MNHTIISRAAIARHAQAAAQRGAGPQANPYPCLHPAHAVWQDCFAVACALLAVPAQPPALAGARVAAPSASAAPPACAAQHRRPLSALLDGPRHA